MIICLNLHQLMNIVRNWFCFVYAAIVNEHSNLYALKLEIPEGVYNRSMFTDELNQS